MVSNELITKLNKRLIEKSSLLIFIFLLISYGFAYNKIVITVVSQINI